MSARQLLWVLGLGVGHPQYSLQCPISHPAWSWAHPAALALPQAVRIRGSVSCFSPTSASPAFRRMEGHQGKVEPGWGHPGALCLLGAASHSPGDTVGLLRGLMAHPSPSSPVPPCLQHSCFVFCPVPYRTPLWSGRTSSFPFSPDPAPLAVLGQDTLPSLPHSFFPECSCKNPKYHEQHPICVHHSVWGRHSLLDTLCQCGGCERPPLIPCLGSGMGPWNSSGREDIGEILNFKDKIVGVVQHSRNGPSSIPSSAQLSCVCNSSSEELWI